MDELNNVNKQNNSFRSSGLTGLFFTAKAVEWKGIYVHASVTANSFMA